MKRLSVSALAVLAAAFFLGSWMTVAPPSPHQEPAVVSAQEDETDRERLVRKIKKLLVENGTEAMQKRSVEDMLVAFETMGMQPEFGEKFVERFDLDHLLELATEVHADHLDEPTVDAMLVFYATPAGRKLAEAMPDITSALMKAGMEYGQEVGTAVAEDLAK